MATTTALAGQGSPRDQAQGRGPITFLEYFRRIRGGELPPFPAAALIGAEIEVVEPGHFVGSMVPRPEHANPAGTVAGGFIATCADFVLTAAVMTMLPAGSMATTLDLNVTFVRPARMDTGRLISTGRLLHLGRSIGVSRAEVTDADGNLLAHGTATISVRLPAA